MLLFLIPFSASLANAQEITKEDPIWQQFVTEHTIIQYQADDDLVTFDSKVHFGHKQWVFKRLFSLADHDDFQKRLKNKIDTIFERVQELLDMRKKMPQVVICFYPTKKQLHDEYFKLYQEVCQIRAWYRYKNNTVYLSITDLNEGILAHELAHAIIDHYLLVRPPAASAEILARYVDSHLQQ
jgi:hypothetical protein